MNTKSIIEIFRGDDSDALGYQTIVGTIHTDLDLSGCKAVFRYLGFFQEFDPIPEDGKLTIVIPSASSMQFPPGLGYASLKVYDIDRKVRTFTNRIPVFVQTKTPCRCGGNFDVEFSPFPELEPLKIFKGPGADDFDLYTGFITKIINRASAEKYGLAMLFDAMDPDKGSANGYAASPAAVKAAYDAIIKELTDNYYTAQETDEAINKLAAYYITYNAAGAAFPTRNALINAQTYYSGGAVRIPTRNDYAVVSADETHGGAEYRYIYAVAEEQTTGNWEAQYPVGGVMTIDQAVTKNSANPVTSSGIWSAIWGAFSAMGFTSLYDWVVAQLAPKAARIELFPAWAVNTAYTTYSLVIHENAVYRCTTAHTSGAEWDSTKWAVASGAEVLAMIRDYLALSNKPQINGYTLTGEGSQSGASLGLLDLAGGTMTGGIAFSAQGTVGFMGLVYDEDDNRLRIIDGWNENIAYLEVPNSADGSRVAFMSDVANAIAAIPYDRITITTGQLQDHAEQKVTLNAATTTLSLPALTDLTGKVSDFGIDVVNGYAPSDTPTAASFSLAGTIGTDYNLIVPEGEDWSEMTALAAGEMAVYYFTLSAFQINDKPTWEVMKKVVTLVPVPSAP